MAITFESVQDPYGLQKAGSVLGQALMQKALMDRQDQKEIKERQIRGSAFQDALAAASKPDATMQDKIGAFQQYAAMTGDTKSFGPMINQLIKQDTRQMESQASIDFLRQMGIDVPQDISGSGIPPASFLGNFAAGLKPTFEPESEKIEAKRTADFADQVVKEYQAAQTSKNRLAQMEIAAKSGQLPTPAMVKTMDFLGVPLSVFANPTAEAYEKNVNEYIKDVSNYFPGQIRVAEIEAYMKTIPTLLNSDEGKQIIIENQKLVNEQKEAAYQAYLDILRDNKGKKPRNLDVEILERTKGIRQEVGDKLKENFIKAVDMSAFPTEKVAQGTALTPNLALTYLNKAGGDRKKAEEMARKDGYEF